MKRQTLYDLIKSHFDVDEKNFLKATKQISRDLFDLGDKQLANEINKLVRHKSRVMLSSGVALPKMILSEEQQKLIQIMQHGFQSRLLNKTFLYGPPGTGKTAFARLLASKLELPINSIRLSQVIDSKLGQSMKLLDKVFHTEGKQLIFIDEIDSIASKRGSKNDIFEISRVLNHLLQLIDTMDHNKLLVVATNMETQIDPAFIRRFDISWNFNCYDAEDILNIFAEYVRKYKIVQHDKLFTTNLEKLIKHSYNFWTPGYIKRIVQMSSLWLQAGHYPSNQIIEILKLIKMGNTKEEIKQQLLNVKVPIRTIRYLLGDMNERYN